MSGGAGYVFSKEVLKRFAQKPCTCKSGTSTSGTEDIEIGECMQSLGKFNHHDVDVEALSLLSQDL